MSKIRNITRAIVFPVFVLAAVSCNSFGRWEKNYETGFFPDSVINLHTVNTRFDDYNSAGPPTIGYNFPLVFSTNRGSEGEEYDLISYNLFIYFDQHDGSLDIFGTEGMYPYFYLADMANSASNEFGPFNIAFGTQEFLFMFASDRPGNMDIYASYYDEYTFSMGSMADPTPFRIKGINSSSYDAYPSFLPDGSQVVFCSNRDGNLDLYKHDLKSKENLLAWARRDTVYPVELLENLNSPAEDACPYINGKLMVFASKRAGGYGGYDLYYSIRGETEWSDPVNFGPDINTEYDEFRPVAFFAYSFDNDLMLFSSNRPGGKGGFDLYYTGIKKMME